MGQLRDTHSLHIHTGASHTVRKMHLKILGDISEYHNGCEYHLHVVIFLEWFWPAQYRTGFHTISQIFWGVMHGWCRAALGYGSICCQGRALLSQLPHTSQEPASQPVYTRRENKWPLYCKNLEEKVSLPFLGGISRQPETCFLETECSEENKGFWS